MLIYRKQEHVRGCGLACVAMLTGLPYNWIRDDYDEIFGPPERSKSLTKGTSSLEYGTDAQDLNALLEANDFNSNKRLISFKSWNDLPEFAILAVRYKQHKKYGNETWHWVVFDRKENVVYDPWISKEEKQAGKIENIRTDYKRMRPKFFLGVFYTK